MEDDTKVFPHKDAGGGTPLFLKLAFLACVVWAVYYLWRNVLTG